MSERKTRRVLEREFESMSKDRLLEFQWGKFQRVLQTAWERSPFYQRKFQAAGMEPGDIRTPDDIARVPMTTKQELLEDVASNPPYGSRLQVDPREVVNIVETSGTTGKAKEVHVQAAEDMEWVYRMEATGFVWAGAGPNTRTMITWPVTMTAAGTWRAYTLFRLRANFIRAGHLSAEERLKYLKRYGVEVLMVTPSYLSRLEALAQEMGMDPRRDLPELRIILVVGEPRSAPWVLQREERWGAQLFEQWGCTQGAVAWSCEEGMAPEGKLGVLHSLPHISMVEVVDRDTREHVCPGGEGEIVLTPLEAHAAPLIRFASNDRAIFRDSESCPCGRPFDGIQAGGVSRYDDMIKIKGVNVWPDAVSRVLDRHPGVQEHRGQVYLDPQGREMAVIDVEMARGTNAQKTLSEVSAELRKELGIGFELREWKGSAPLNSLVFNPQTGKTRRWDDRRDEGPLSPL